ncbi:MAG: hypothetical protein ACREMW_05900 [Gemmatimonadales bacterium]
MVADIEAAIEAQITARRDHIGATAELAVLTTQLALQVKVIDGITRYRFGNDPEMMAEWQAARQVSGQRLDRSAAPPVSRSVPERVSLDLVRWRAPRGQGWCGSRLVPRRCQVESRGHVHQVGERVGPHRREYDSMLIAVEVHAVWDEDALGVAIGTIAHTAYHLGAIRQRVTTQQQGA